MFTQSWDRLSTSAIEFQCLLGEMMWPGWAQLLVACGLCPSPPWATEGCETHGDPCTIPAWVLGPGV